MKVFKIIKRNSLFDITLYNFEVTFSKFSLDEVAPLMGCCGLLLSSLSDTTQHVQSVSVSDLAPGLSSGSGHDTLSSSDTGDTRHDHCTSNKFTSIKLKNIIWRQLYFLLFFLCRICWLDILQIIVCGQDLETNQSQITRAVMKTMRIHSA